MIGTENAGIKGSIIQQNTVLVVDAHKRLWHDLLRFDTNMRIVVDLFDMNPGELVILERLHVGALKMVRDVA